MDSRPELSMDTIFEILSRTSSLKTLDTCKMVCKDWKQLERESNFMPAYCKNTNNVYGYYVQDRRRMKHVQEFISLKPSELEKQHTSIKVDRKLWEDDMRIEASSKQGILCVVRTKHRRTRFYVCKPCTGQWQPLPNPKLRFSTVKVALLVLHSNPFRYKIVRLSKDCSPGLKKNYYSCCCEIFDSKGWEWRRTKDVELPYAVFLDSKNPSVEAGGLIYWLTTDGHALVFNHEDDTYSRFPLPAGLMSHSISLIEYEGKLGCLGLTAQAQAQENRKIETYQLWILDDRKNLHSWRLVEEIEVVLEPSVTLQAGLYNRDIALLSDYYKLVFDHLQESVSTESLVFEHFFPFRSDLDPINLRGE